MTEPLVPSRDIPPEQLAGRSARCKCGREAPSIEVQADGFYEYLGPGSRHAREVCGVCRYHRCAHEYDLTRINREPAPAQANHDFTPIGPAERDRYWCGCGNTD